MMMRAQQLGRADGTRDYVRLQINAIRLEFQAILQRDTQKESKKKNRRRDKYNWDRETPTIVAHTKTSGKYKKSRRRRRRRGKTWQTQSRFTCTMHINS